MARIPESQSWVSYCRHHTLFRKLFSLSEKNANLFRYEWGAKYVGRPVKEKHLTCDLRLSSRLKWTLLSSGLLRGLGWFNTDVSGRPIGPIFKDKAVQDDRLDSPETSVWNDLTMCNNQENEIIQYVTYLHQLLDIFSTVISCFPGYRHHVGYV